MLILQVELMIFNLVAVTESNTNFKPASPNYPI